MTVEHLIVTCEGLEAIRHEVMRSAVGDVTVERVLAEGRDPKIVMNFLTRLEIIDEI